MTGLIGWWPLHEDSGSKAYDLSGNGNHGSLNGGVTQGVAGKGGLTSYSFDGNDDVVKVSGSNLDTTSPPWTFTAWIKRKGSFGDEQKFFGQSPADETYQAGQFSLQFSNSSHPEQNKFYIGVGGGSTEVIGNTVVDDRKWHHVALQYDGSEWKVYLDGELDGSTTSVPSPSNVSTDPLWIAAVYNSWSNVNMTDARFYSRTLSSDEIKTLHEWGSGDYARPPNDSDSSAVSRWAFDGNVDDSWGSNNGTTSGGLSWSNDAIRGQAADFDGNDDRVEVSDSVAFDIGSGESLTCSFWLKSSLTGYSHVLVGKGELAGGVHKVWDIITNGERDLRFSYQDGSNDAYAYASGVRDGNWHHVTGVYEQGAGVKAYVDGVKVDEGAGNISGWTNDYPLDIGGTTDEQTPDPYGYFQGLIDDLRVYNRALSPEEIFELYRWGTRGRDMRKFTVNSRGL
ncbi:LamG domain-containing protein [Candidatus Nanosalina sp. VS9-1]|uniref:LamG domain-containing protein n=1 Tax=Candidatus Nanosalina sp. VS9-1 TaxID=3388566 RepID=UPI0039E041B4